MEYLKIKNSGELDVRLIPLMGGTTKSENSNQIGQFGTGLKYTLAFLVRNNIDFRVFVGEQEIKVKSDKSIIQEEEFNIIYIDGEKTSITDKMGLDWKAWMIIRELYCNALDEGGEEIVTVDSDEVTGEQGSTIFYLQNTSEIKDVLDNWSKYFIKERTPLHESDKHKIYHSLGKLRLYKHGVLIYEDQWSDKKAIFDYDIKHAELNELREYKGIVSLEVTKALEKANQGAIKYFLDNITDENREADLDLDWSPKFSEDWKEIIGNAKVITSEQLDKIKQRGIDIDTSEVIVIPKNLYTQLTKQFKGISKLTVIDKNNDFYETFSSELDWKVKRSIEILEECGYIVDPELTFRYGEFGNSTTMGQMKVEDKEILLSERLADKPLGEIIQVVVEENEHYRTNYQDCSRDFQSHFIELYVNELLKANGIEV